MPVSEDDLQLRRLGERVEVRGLAEYEEVGTAQYKLRTYTSPSVLVVDELGYLPLDQVSANWIFQVVSRRYEKGSGTSGRAAH